jgi:hypothetical protein
VVMVVSGGSIIFIFVVKHVQFCLSSKVTVVQEILFIFVVYHFLCAFVFARP